MRLLLERGQWSIVYAITYFYLPIKLSESEEIVPCPISKLIPNSSDCIDLWIGSALECEYIIGFMLLGRTRHGKQIQG